MRGLRELGARYRRHAWLRWSVDGLAVLLLFSAVMAWQTRRLPASGTPAPPFALRTLDGRTVQLEALRGRPVLLAFWAPWCGVCKASSANLSAVQKRVGERAHVLSVAVAYEEVEAVRRYVAEQGVDYPVLLGDDALREAYRVDTFPTTLFLSPEGHVRRAAVGYTTQVGLLWRLWL